MIRSLTAADIDAAKVVIDENDLFPSVLLDDMVAPFLGGPFPDVFWLVDDRDGVAGLLYCVPERMTSGTWNNLLLAVRPHHHGHGIGSALLRHIEDALRQRRARVILVETSGLDSFDRTRRFYRHAGYGEEARIRDFYQAGEDKIVFRKEL